MIWTLQRRQRGTRKQLVTGRVVSDAASFVHGFFPPLSDIFARFQYFRTGRQLLNITGCRDLTSLQAVCFMILFLQFSAELSTCYSYIGIAVRSALRLGLHRSLVTHFDIIERELRKRVFWVIWRMDTQVSTALGMPLLINEDDIDQDLPLLLDDIYVSPKGTPPLSFTNTCLMAGVNAHIALVKILAKAVKCIYPVGNAKPSLATAQEFEENHSKIQEIEKNLQDWVKALPAALRPEEDAPKEIDRYVMDDILRLW